MKKLLIFLLIIIGVYGEQHYNISIGEIEMSEENNLAIVSLGSGGDVYLNNNFLTLYAESGFLFMTTNDIYTNSRSYYSSKSDVFIDLGLYFESGLMFKNKHKSKVKPYAYTSLKGTYFVSRLFDSEKIPGVEDFLPSGKFGIGLEFKNGFFIEYNYEIYKNKHSNFTSNNRLYANNIKIGARY